MNPNNKIGSRVPPKVAALREARDAALTPEAEKEADKVCHNLPGLEAAWAHKCADYADEHEAFLARVPRNAKIIRLTGIDDEIYKAFRTMFPSLDVKLLVEDDLKTEKSKSMWRQYCMHFEHRVEDYNYGTLLRLDASKPYSPENTTLAPRVQFYAVEIARLREGANVEVMAPAKEDLKDTDEYYIRVCAVCGKEAPYRCTHCKNVRYCSRECQKADWKTHKPICK